MNAVAKNRIAVLAMSALLVISAALAVPRAALAAGSSADLAAGSASLSTQAATPSVSYRVHVQNVGWQTYRSDGAMAGTSGQSLRLEGINIKLDGAPTGSGIKYRTHVQNVGWQTYRSDGAMAGTSGRSLRLEGIEIELTGDAVNSYDVFYRVHVQNVGWMDWVKNGELAGTTGRSLRLEGIEIKLVKKGTTPSISYSAHVQDIGWMSEVGAGKTAGTTGKGKRVEALKFNVSNGSYTGTVQCRAHVQNVGWQDYVPAGSVSGTTGRGLRVEAISMRLTGELANSYDVYYRAHVQNYGWLDWAKNGDAAGSTGKSLRVEAVEVVLVAKGGAAPGGTDAPTVNLLRTKLNGIDIASWQEGINIASVDADFVIVKATQGTTYINPYFRQWADATLASGKRLGLYHFAVTGDAEKQADYFVTQVGPYVGKAALFLDWENNDMTGDPTLLQGAGWAKRFLDRVYAKTGVRPLIYMSKSVTRSYDWSSVAPTYGLWVAQYPNYNTTGYQSDPWTDSYGYGAWSAPTIFQYTSSGRISGYSGNLDLDLFYGTETAWDALASKR